MSAKRNLPGYRSRDCACCTRTFLGAANVCAECMAAHGWDGRKYMNGGSECPVYAGVEKAAQEKIAALSPSAPLVVSPAMHNRVMGLDG